MDHSRFSTSKECSYEQGKQPWIHSSLFAGAGVFFTSRGFDQKKIPESDQVGSRFLNIVPLLLSSLLVVYIYVYYIIMIWLVVSIIFCFPEYMG